MCGIFAFFGETENKEKKLIEYGMKSKNRGPDNTFHVITPTYFLMFHRLMINDTTSAGNQPMTMGGVTLMCNGEIYNHKKLSEKYEIKTDSKSDCEIIIHLYKKIGFIETIKQLDGVFAIVLIDGESIFVARDPIGVRSLFMAERKNGNKVDKAFGSELKNLNILFNGCEIKQFPVGCVLINNVITRYYDNQYLTPDNENNIETITEIKKKINEKLTNAVIKRLMSDREIGCLLSGGLDSSLITALVSNMMKKRGKRIQTFSIGLKGSEDLKYAKLVAKHLNTVHHEVIVSEDKMLKTIEEDISIIESYDTTTVRASVPMYLLCKYISEHTDVKVLYSGEGSDEASGSYLYFHNCPNSDEFKDETLRLMDDLSYFDVLRCDKSVSSCGLEVRVPFLDKDFLNYYMRINPTLKMPDRQNGVIEKYLLRSSFDINDLLPHEVLWRVKEGMSDGVSSKRRSWFKIIQDMADALYTDKEFEEKSRKYNYHNPPMFKEALLFREIYSGYFTECDKLIPYYWLPKWCGEVVEPSARILHIYTNKV